jgi:hypothetical protein
LFIKEAEANHALKAANQAEAVQQLTNQQIEQVTTETVQTTPGIRIIVQEIHNLYLAINNSFFVILPFPIHYLSVFHIYSLLTLKFKL